MWITLLIIAAVIVGLLYLFGVITPVAVYNDKWLAPHLVYYVWRGPSHQLSAQFAKIDKDLMEGQIKFANGFGIYYTDLKEEIWDCVLGFEVNRGETAKVEAFLQGHPQYKEAKLKNTRYIGTRLPYINFLSFMLARPKITQFKKILKEKNVEPSRGIIERYYFLPAFGKTIELIQPTQNEDQWNLL